jgi:hypothetical protein
LRHNFHRYVQCYFLLVRHNLTDCVNRPLRGIYTNNEHHVARPN